MELPEPRIDEDGNRVIFREVFRRTMQEGDTMDVYDLVQAPGKTKTQNLKARLYCRKIGRAHVEIEFTIGVIPKNEAPV